MAASNCYAKTYNVIYENVLNTISLLLFHIYHYLKQLWKELTISRGLTYLGVVDILLHILLRISSGFPKISEANAMST